MAKYIVEETKTSKYEKNFKFPLINLIPAIVWCIPVHQKLSPLAGTMFPIVSKSLESNIRFSFIITHIRHLQAFSLILLFLAYRNHYQITY